VFVFSDDSEVKLKKLMKYLEGIRGRHTELISVYISAGQNIQETQAMLRQEYALTQNVKSRTTRNNVLNALEKVMNRLKLFNQTPPNGLIVFAGNVSEKEGQQDIQVWSVEPPQPLTQKLYWCDQKFVLDPLKDMLREKEIYGLILIDTGGATIGFLKGKKVVLEKEIDSLVPGKTKAGGWSQMRYLRIREEAKNDHLKKTGELANDIFMKVKDDLKGIIIGGPGPFKEKFDEGDFINYALKEKKLGIVDTSYMGMPGLEEMVQRGEHLIQEASMVKERELLSRYFENLQKDNGLSVYGMANVRKALEMGAVDKLIVSEDFNWTRKQLVCNCGTREEKDSKPGMVHKCSNCGADMTVEGERDMIDILEDEVKSFGSEFHIVSVDTREGAQFKELGGVGAILRYRLS
jgi:peptide chain release factor subunit 1